MTRRTRNRFLALRKIDFFNQFRYMKKFHQKAFSLIEVSVIILIISVVLIGVVKGNYLLSRSRLASAKTLTQRSGISDIPDLALWLETSLESSFIQREAQDKVQISTWYNNQNTSPKNNAAQTTQSKQPSFYEDAFNGAIPAIRFDGSNDFLIFDGSNLANTNYTIFVVEQRRSNASNNYFLGGTEASTLFLGYSSNTEITFSQSDNAISYGSVASYNIPTPRIHTVNLSNAGKRYWLNGASVASNSTQTMISSFAGAALGRSVSSYFNGDIGEVIIFTRALRTDERMAIENYLSKKYDIKIS